MTTYRDFEDLRDNCPDAYRAEIAVDLDHPDPSVLNDLWAATIDGEFRLALTGAISRFWEDEVRGAGSDIPEDHFAMELNVDSYADPEMGHTLYLDGVAYCGSEEVGEVCWEVLSDDTRERRFAAFLVERVEELLAGEPAVEDLVCTVEVSEVAQL
jgi:hypothetical protein